ncbi:MAG: thioredoxin [Candidatus Omnitrophica bacterium]|nr:thioredoxin [Candidatus Omnitrophota bacterium]
MVNLTDASFKHEVLDSEIPVLVDFWAPWCGPCKMIAPLLEELTKAYEGRIKIAKLNVDDNPDSASRYSIMSIPTLIFFNKGKIMEQVAGVLGKAELKRKLEEYL